MDFVFGARSLAIRWVGISFHERECSITIPPIPHSDEHALGCHSESFKIAVVLHYDYNEEEFGGFLKAFFQLPRGGTGFEPRRLLK
jgi:hypothetical protein